MRKVSFLIAVCFVLAVMVVSISAQGGGGGQRGPAAPPPPAASGANGAADLPSIMLNIAATNRGMGPKVTAGDAAGVATDLATLQTLFTSAQTAFTKEKVKGASDLAKAAADAAGAAMKVAKAGKVDATTTKAVADACNGCHNGPPAYRTKDPTTNTYKLNPMP